VENRFQKDVEKLCNYIRSNVADARIVVKNDLPFSSNKNQYNEFCSMRLQTLFVSPHAIVCQLDGFPINWSSWSNEFLKYDYIGAPWPHTLAPKECRVGNGGFSLRSRRLCQAASKEDWVPMPDDVFICQHLYAKMQGFGIRYAPPSLAARFSVEHDVPEKVQQPFGFHNLRVHPQFKL
jgi:hypothetical protein